MPVFQNAAGVFQNAGAELSSKGAKITQKGFENLKSLRNNNDSGTKGDEKHANTRKTLKTLSKINISEPKWRAPACVLKNRGRVLKNRGCVLKKPPLRFEKTSGTPLR